jgi:glycerophosphoryl diester phosphodiesterase
MVPARQLAALVVALLGVTSCAPREAVQLGPRPFYLVDSMPAGALKERLQACSEGPFKPSGFSIGHRGAPLQFPEHTVESYRAAARMGAGVLECDVTFTRDRELVCRHSQCDLHRTTNILTTPLAALCRQPFRPAQFRDGMRIEPATATCCTSDITLEQFLSLRGKMDAFDENGLTVDQALDATPAWRTDLYSGNGTLVSHAQSIELFQSLGVQMTPELKAPEVAMPFNGMSRRNLADRLVEECREAGVPAESIWLQSFSLEAVRYWIEAHPEYGRQAVFLDGRYGDDAFDHRVPETWQPSMTELAASGVRFIGSPLWMLLEASDNGPVPSAYARAARAAGLEIIAWTLERSPPAGQAEPDWYFRDLGTDPMTVLHVLAEHVGVRAVFSDWPATTTYYANCTGRP